jgi:organic hydroperoxide reductase OsmC/OhrA
MEDKTADVTFEYSSQTPDVYLMKTNAPFLPDIRIDYTDVPVKKRKGAATQLLCSSLLYCFAGFLGSNLHARKAQVNSIAGRAYVYQDRDENSRMCVSKCRLEVDVDMEGDEDGEILDQCREIMNRGCLLSHSVEQGVAMEYDIRRVTR